jgi:predicted  nucleic acid-binding Zn-ribbon protein
MSRISDLWQLQEIDSALDTRRASLEDAEARIGSSEEVAAAQATLDERRGTLREARDAQRDLETQAEDQKGKIAPAEEKLYSGAIKNPRELSDLQADIAQLKQQLSTLEDRVLEAIAAVEAAEGDERTAAAELAALDQAWREEQEDLAERVSRLRAEIAGYDEQRRERAEYIDTDLLRTYDHVRRAHQGKGIAKVDRNLCLGCRISLPVTLVNKARNSNNTIQCPNCERILYA